MEFVQTVLPNGVCDGLVAKKIIQPGGSPDGTVLNFYLDYKRLTNVKKWTRKTFNGIFEQAKDHQLTYTAINSQRYYLESIQDGVNNGKFNFQYKMPSTTQDSLKFKFSSGWNYFYKLGDDQRYSNVSNVYFDQNGYFIDPSLGQMISFTNPSGRKLSLSYQNVITGLPSNSIATARVKINPNYIYDGGLKLDQAYGSETFSYSRLNSIEESVENNVSKKITRNFVYSNPIYNGIPDFYSLPQTIYLETNSQNSFGTNLGNEFNFYKQRFIDDKVRYNIITEILFQSLNQKLNEVIKTYNVQKQGLFLQIYYVPGYAPTATLTGNNIYEKSGLISVETREYLPEEQIKYKYGSKVEYNYIHENDLLKSVYRQSTITISPYTYSTEFYDNLPPNEIYFFDKNLSRKKTSFYESIATDLSKYTVISDELYQYNKQKLVKKVELVNYSNDEKSSVYKTTDTKYAFENDSTTILKSRNVLNAVSFSCTQIKNIFTLNQANINSAIVPATVQQTFNGLLSVEKALVMLALLNNQYGIELNQLSFLSEGSKLLFATLDIFQTLKMLNVSAIIRNLESGEFWPDATNPYKPNPNGPDYQNYLSAKAIIDQQTAQIQSMGLNAVQSGDVRYNIFANGDQNKKLWWTNDDDHNYILFYDKAVLAYTNIFNSTGSTEINKTLTTYSINPNASTGQPWYFAQKQWIAQKDGAEMLNNRPQVYSDWKQISEVQTVDNKTGIPIKTKYFGGEPFYEFNYFGSDVNPSATTNDLGLITRRGVSKNTDGTNGYYFSAGYDSKRLLSSANLEFGNPQNITYNFKYDSDQRMIAKRRGTSLLDSMVFYNSRQSNSGIFQPNNPNSYKKLSYDQSGQFNHTKIYYDGFGETQTELFTNGSATNNILIKEPVFSSDYSVAGQLKPVYKSSGTVPSFSTSYFPGEKVNKSSLSGITNDVVPVYSNENIPFSYTVKTMMGSAFTLPEGQINRDNKRFSGNYVLYSNGYKNSYSIDENRTGFLVTKQNLSGLTLETYTLTNPSYVINTASLDMTSDASILNNLSAWIVGFTGAGAVISNKVTYTYDDKLRLTTVTHPNGTKTKYRYDYFGNIVKKETPDHEGKLMVTSLPEDSVDVNPDFQYAYDVYGRLLYSVDPNQSVANKMTYYIYDWLNRLTETGEVEADTSKLNGKLLDANQMSVTQPNNWLVMNTYDGSSTTDMYFETNNAKGMLTKKTEKISRADGPVQTIQTYYSYTPEGWLKRITENNGAGFYKEESFLNYDLQGKLLEYKISMKRYFADSYVTLQHRWITYDGFGRVANIKISNQSDAIPINPTVAYTYNADGTVKQTSLANGLQNVDYLYNIRGWLTDINNATSQPALGTDKFAEKLNYWDNLPTGISPNYNGNISAVYEKNFTGGGATIDSLKLGFTYDNLNRLTSSKSFTNSSTLNNFYNTAYSYDVMGNITSLNRYTKNGVGLSKMMDYLSYTYQGNRLMNITDTVAAVRFGADYDAKTPGADIAYDQLLYEDMEATTALDSWTKTNTNNWVTVIRSTTGSNPTSNRMRIEVVVQPYSNASATVKATKTIENIISGATYQLSGLVQSNNYYCTFGIEWLNSSNGIISSSNASVSYAGNTIKSVVAAAPAGAVKANIVVSLYYPTNSSTGNYIAVDNIKLEEKTPFDYDNNGNLVQDANRSISDIAYNQFNLPIKITKSDASVIRYAYNQNGQRIMKKITYATNPVTSDSTYYLRDYTGNTLAEFRKNWNMDSLNYVNYLGNSNEVIGKRYKESGIYKEAYYLKDHLGNIRTTVGNSSGTPIVVAAQDYYPFGATLRSSFTSGSTREGRKYQFQGKERDVETSSLTGLEENNGTDYFEARGYDAQLGRFIQVDKKAFKGFDMSPYSGMANNPVRLIDKVGNWPTDIHYKILDRAFGAKFNQQQMETVKWFNGRNFGAADGPETQKPQFSYMHAMMYDQDTYDQAKKSFNKNINDRIEDYTTSNSEQTKFVALAFGLHAIMDYTSPAHFEFQQWDGAGKYILGLISGGKLGDPHYYVEKNITEEELEIATLYCNLLLKYFEENKEFDIDKFVQEAGIKPKSRAQFNSNPFSGGLISNPIDDDLVRTEDGMLINRSSMIPGAWE